ncbi:hypothetical protein [Sphaerisporangium sp. TRM90804]|uniref:hypothetical protein n=1 Tax=Sphaerisporangium sp. TRM90804 TaxID=3031113 RepID=UPI00244C43F4|nr:hypothetical protein [Sphaerisporangium sp. TRM90804]MDH2426452.1 hypothetical protein [Sphaerisporangium sp. TRM90804]
MSISEVACMNVHSFLHAAGLLIRRPQVRVPDARTKVAALTDRERGMLVLLAARLFK